MKMLKDGRWMGVTVCSCTITTTVDPRKSKSVTHLLVFCCSSILIGLSHNTQVKNLDLRLHLAQVVLKPWSALERTLNASAHWIFRIMVRRYWLCRFLHTDACSMIGYWHHTVICLSVCDAVYCSWMIHTAKVSEQVNRKCSPSSTNLQLLTPARTLPSHPQNVEILSITSCIFDHVTIFFMSMWIAKLVGWWVSRSC